MSTHSTSKNIYRDAAIKAHRDLISLGMFNEASRLLRSLIRRDSCINISLSDTDWNLAEFMGRPGAYSIKIN